MGVGSTFDLEINRNIFHAVGLVVCCFLSGMILKETSISVEQLATFLQFSPSVSPTFIKQFILDFIRLFEFKILNIPPDMIFRLFNNEYALEKKYVQKIVYEATLYPWLQSNILNIYKNIYGSNLLVATKVASTKKMETFNDSNESKLTQDASSKQ